MHFKQWTVDDLEVWSPQLESRDLGDNQEVTRKVQGQLLSSRVKPIPQDAINESLSWKMNPALVIAATSIKFKSAFLHA